MKCNENYLSSNTKKKKANKKFTRKHAVNSCCLYLKLIDQRFRNTAVVKPNA